MPHFYCFITSQTSRVISHSAVKDFEKIKKNAKIVKIISTYKDTYGSLFWNSLQQFYFLGGYLLVFSFNNLMPIYFCKNRKTRELEL